MTTPIMLDTGPLETITHPRRNPDTAKWLQHLLQAVIPIILPEITDYELRRNLLLEGLTASLHRLDRLKELLIYLPLTTETMLLAAQLWAEARKQGHPTADPKALDGDVILAAQAMHANAIIATENIGHLSRFVTAKHWRNISL